MTDRNSSSSKGSGNVIPLPVVLPAKRAVSEYHLPNLRASGLTDETIELAALYSEDRPKVLAQLVERRSWPSDIQGSALIIPFYLPGASEPHACRLRPSKPRAVKSPSGKQRLVKYDQASSAGLLVYFTPRARAAGWYGHQGKILYWTEGEKKALVLDQEGLTCVGLTGVWNWLDVAHKDSGGGERLHPHILAHVAIAGRAHVIVFDADAKQNDQVMLAAQRLCGVLLAAGAASVRFVCPPDAEQQKGIDDYYAAHGGDTMRQLLAGAAAIEPADPKQPLMLVRKCVAFRDAPLDESLRVPEGYELQRNGSLWLKGKNDDTFITALPVFLTRITADQYSSEERAEISWPRPTGEWSTLCVTKRALNDSRTMVAECSAYGAPITSGNAGKLVDWFAAFETCNPALPRLASVGSAGWHGAGSKRVFVADEPIGPEDQPLPFLLDTRGERRKMFAPLAPRGTLEAHSAALRRAWDASPVAACMIAGALCAPLLEPLKCPNFAIHLVGESSRGKTTQLKIAASVYGDPSSSQWVASWNVTPAGAEMRASIMNDLPQCFDEIGGGDPQMAERMVYSLINGGGKTRATKELTLRETLSWRTVVLSTGERELADATTATGAQVRVVQLPVDGFGDFDASQVDALRDECAAHAGSLGRAWLHKLVNTEDWDVYRNALTQLTAAVRLTVEDPLQSRVAGYFALLALTEAMVSESFGLGRRDGGTLRELFNWLGSRQSVQGVAERAREEVESWVMSEPDAFPELNINAHGGLEEPKSNGVRTRHGFRKPDGTLLILKAEFRAFCKKHRFDQKTVVHEWALLGWTDCDATRPDKQIKIGSSRARYVLLTALANTDTDESFTRKSGEQW